MKREIKYIEKYTKGDYYCGGCVVMPHQQTSANKDKCVCPCHIRFYENPELLEENI